MVSFTSANKFGGCCYTGDIFAKFCSSPILTPLSSSSSGSSCNLSLYQNLILMACTQHSSQREEIYTVFFLK